MRDNKPAIITVFIFYIIIGAIGYIVIRENEKKQKYYYDNYPIVEKQKFYSGVIIKMYYEHGRTFINLQNGEKISFSWAYNNKYRKNFFKDFIQVEDSVVKPANSDSIMIFRKDEMYYFLMNKHID